MRIRPNISLLFSVGVLALLSAVSLGAADDLRLVEAARNQRRDVVRQLLGQNVDVNVAQPDGATALHWAAHWDDAESVELLIRAGANVNAANDYGVTPLLLASLNGNASVVAALLRGRANPNLASSTGDTPLIAAAKSGSRQSVLTLLRGGAEIEAKERAVGESALTVAAAEGHGEVVQVLLEAGADVHARSLTGFTPLMSAARTGDIKTARVLLAGRSWKSGSGADVNEMAFDGTTALTIAVVRGHTAFAEFLLDLGADPNVGPGYTPLHWASGAWDTTLTAGETSITAESTEWNDLGGLRGERKLRMVNALLGHGADPNARIVATPPRYGYGGGGGNLVGATAIFLAAQAGDVALMRLLLDKGADPSLSTVQNTTLLMAAAGYGHSQGATVTTEAQALEAIALVLQLGGEARAASVTGDTALHQAAGRGAVTVAKRLLDSGANLNARNNARQSALTITEGTFQDGVFIRFPEVEALLHQLGAEPSPPDVER